MSLTRRPSLVMGIHSLSSALSSALLPWALQPRPLPQPGRDPGPASQWGLKSVCVGEGDIHRMLQDCMVSVLEEHLYRGCGVQRAPHQVSGGNNHWRPERHAGVSQRPDQLRMSKGPTGWPRWDTERWKGDRLPRASHVALRRVTFIKGTGELLKDLAKGE